MKKHISALLLIAMLAGMASCGSEVSPASDVTGTSSGMDTTTAPETADPRLISDLPDKNFGGYEFRAAKQNPDKIAWTGANALAVRAFCVYSAFRSNRSSSPPCTVTPMLAGKTCRPGSSAR